MTTMDRDKLERKATALALISRVEELERERDDAIVEAGLARRDLQYAEARLQQVGEALRPFAQWAEDTVVEDPFSPGYGIWGGNRCERERIVDWFGPTDFYRARAALSLLDLKEGASVAESACKSEGGAS